MIYVIKVYVTLLTGLKSFVIMNRVFLLLLLFTTCFQASLAQSGSYLVSKHSPVIGHQNIYYAAATNNLGTTYLASRNGLIKYDGHREMLINTGGSVFDIALDGKEHIFLATSVGLLRMDEEDDKIQNLMPVGKTDNVYQVLITKEAIYGLSAYAIYYRLFDSDSTLTIQTELTGKLFSMYELNDQVYVNSENKGTLEVVSGRMSSEVPDFLEERTIVFAVKKDDSQDYLLGTSDSQLFTYTNGEPSLIAIDQSSVGEVEPISALWYSDQIVVVGTVNSGVFFLNINTAKVESIVDYTTGLDDNEVMSLTQDKNKGISVVNQYAVSHILPNIPIKNYEYYEGLSGEVLSTLHHDKKLYVGTNLGLFSLEQITDYEEEVLYVKRRRKITKPLSQTKPKRGLFGFKKKNKKERDKVERSEVVFTEKQTIKKATGVHYTYKKLSENISHVTHLRSINNGVLAGGLSGVFQVQDGEVKSITEYSSRYLYLSTDQQKLFVNTGDQQLLVFIKNNNEWVYRDVFTDFRAQVDHIREYEGYYWLCSPDRIYKVKISNNELDDVEEYPLKNPYYSTTYSTIISDKLSFINSSGSFKFVVDSIVLIENSLRVDHVIIDSQNEPWIISGSEWILPDKYESNTPVFKTFNDLKAITYTNDATYWVVTHDNQILQFHEDAVIPSSYYSPYLEGIRSNNSHVSSDKLTVIQDESELSFEISHPDLPNIFKTKYRYHLQGMDDSWSEWSSQSTIGFAFLPAGSYSLVIEAKNSFGEAYQIDPVSFKVLPPYWQRPWFYAIEFGVVLFIFLVSIKLKSSGYKYRLLSRLLAFLTLVIVIEYLEAIMESYFLLENSPIFGFLLQVLMAIIILPFEGILKKYVFKEKVKMASYFEIKEKKE